MVEATATQRNSFHTRRSKLMQLLPFQQTDISVMKLFPCRSKNQATNGRQGKCKMDSRQKPAQARIVGVLPPNAVGESTLTFPQPVVVVELLSPVM